MEKFLLTDIIKLNRDINFDYRDSKQPLFIKNFILKRRRNKLRKIIDNFTNRDIIDADILYQYFNHLILTYPPNGLYKHCRNMEYLNKAKDIKSVTFCYKLPDTEFQILATFTNQFNENNKVSFDITYSFFHKGKLLYRFVDMGMYYIENTHIQDEHKSPWRSDIEKDCITSTVCKVITDDIKDYFYDMIERSERINE